MLTPQQIQALKDYATSLKSAGKTKDEIISLVNARKQEYYNANTKVEVSKPFQVKKAQEPVPTAPTETPDQPSSSDSKSEKPSSELVGRDYANQLPKEKFINEELQASIDRGEYRSVARDGHYVGGIFSKQYTDEEYEESAKEIEERYKEIYTGEEPIGFFEAIGNELKNIYTTTVWQGRDSQIAEDILMAMATGDRERAKEAEAGLEELELKRDRQMKPVATFEQGMMSRAKGEYFQGFKSDVASAIGGLAGFIGTGIQGIKGLGWGFAMDMMAGGINTYNKQKAEALGISLEELIETGNGEVLVPTAITGAGLLLERAGVKKVGKAINSMSPGLKKQAFSYLNAFGSEGATEYGQSILENYNEIRAQKYKGKTKLSLQDELDLAYDSAEYMFSAEAIDAGLKGGFGGAGAKLILSPNARKAAAAARDVEANKRIAKDVKELSDIVVAQAKQDLRTKKGKQMHKILEESKKAIRKRIEEEVKAGDKIYDAMTATEVEQVGKSVDDIRKTQKKIQRIQADKKLDESAKQSALKAQEDILLQKQQDIFETRKRAEKRAQETQGVTRFIKATGIKDLNVLTVKSEAELKELQDKNSPKYDPRYDDLELSDYGMITTTTKDGKSTNTIVINEDVGSRDAVYTTGRHEVGHYVLSKLFNQKGFGTKVLNLMKPVIKQNADLQNIVDRYTKRGADVDLMGEEVFMAFIEGIEDKSIKIPDNVATQFGDSLRRGMRGLGLKGFKFETTSDLTNFAKDFNKMYTTGKQAKRFSRLTEMKLEQAGVDTTKKSLGPDANVFVEADRLERNKETQKKYNERVDKLVGPKNADGDYTMTKAEWDAGGLFEAYEALVSGNQLDALLLKGMKADQLSVFGKDKSDFLQQLKDDWLTKHIMKFNPERNNSLMGWINASTGRGITVLGAARQQILNKYQKELDELGGEKAKSLDVEAGEGGAVFGMDIASTDAFDTEAEFEARRKAEEEMYEAEPKVSKAIDVTTKVGGQTVDEFIDNAMDKAVDRALEEFMDTIDDPKVTSNFRKSFESAMSTKKLEDFARDLTRAVGVENFFKAVRVPLLYNQTESILLQNNFFRKVIQKKLRKTGEKIFPTQTEGNPFDYQYLLENGKKAERKDFAREEYKETKRAAGHTLSMKSTDLDSMMPEDLFLDYFYKDGKEHRRNQDKSISSTRSVEISTNIRRQAAQTLRQLANEKMINQIQAKEGPLYDKIADNNYVMSNLGAQQAAGMLLLEFDQKGQAEKQTKFSASRKVKDSSEYTRSMSNDAFRDLLSAVAEDGIDAVKSDEGKNFWTKIGLDRFDIITSIPENAKDFWKRVIKSDKERVESNKSNNNLLSKFGFKGKGQSKEQTAKMVAKQDADKRREAKKAYNAKYKDPAKLGSDIIAQATGEVEDISVNEAIQKAKKAKKQPWLMGRSSNSDMHGMLRMLTGKGKLGEAQIKFFEDFILKPFNKGMVDLGAYTIRMHEELKQLKDIVGKLGITQKELNKEISGGYTVEDAVRVYLWRTAPQANGDMGFDIPNLDSKDSKALREFMSKPENKKYMQYAYTVSQMIKNKNANDTYPQPGDGWKNGSIGADLRRFTYKQKRKDFLQQFEDNFNEVFTKENLLKMEAKFGKEWVRDFKKLHKLMYTGELERVDSTIARGLRFLEGSIANIMFINTKSALLQLVSAGNILFEPDFNVIQGFKSTLTNPKAYLNAVKYIASSTYAKNRKLQNAFDVTAAELTKQDAAGNTKGWLRKLRSFGFKPAQFMDGLAIAIGYAPYLRQKKAEYEAAGLSEQEAAEQAMYDVAFLAEGSQQSSREDRVSLEQRDPIKRVALSFTSTVQQYGRKTDTAIKDLKAGRGNKAQNIAILANYAVMQHMLFNYLSNALWTQGEDEDEEMQEKIIKNLVETNINGFGVRGQLINALLRTVDNEIKKSKGEYSRSRLLTALSISPSIQDKADNFERSLGALQKVFKDWEYEKEVWAYGNWDQRTDTASYEALMYGLDLAGLPGPDRLSRWVTAYKNTNDQDLETLEKTLSVLGWSDYALNIGSKRFRSKKKKLSKGLLNLDKSGTKVNLAKPLK